MASTARKHRCSAPFRGWEGSDFDSCLLLIDMGVPNAIARVTQARNRPLPRTERRAVRAALRTTAEMGTATAAHTNH